MHRRVPPSATFWRATAWPVVPLPAKKSSTTESAGIVCRIRRTRPVGLGDSKTCPTTTLSSATAVSVEPTSSASQMVRSFFRRPPGPSRCSQSFWKTSTRSPRAPLDHPADQVVGALLDQRPPTTATPPAGRRRTPARSPPAPSNGAALTRPLTGSPYTGKCRVRAVTGLNFLLVLRSGRCRYRRPSGAVQREVGRVHGLRAARVQHAPAYVAGVDQQVLVASREPLAELPPLGVEVHDHLGEEVGLAEHLVHQQPQLGRPRCRRC